MLTGLNHLTLAVTDVPRSVAFYTQALQCRLHAQWDAGAYLALGEVWLCLSRDARRDAVPPPEYTHCAFSIKQADFAEFVAHALAQGARPWKVNCSEGDSFYFLDPDGHQLEAHVGSLASRLAQCRQHPYPGMVFFD